MVKNLRGVLSQAFLSLPLILIGWSLFLGCTQGNIGLLVLAMGLIFVVPVATFLLNTLAEFVGYNFEEFLTVPNKDFCNIVPGSADYTIGNLWVTPSYWMANVTFFFAFLISSASYIYTMPSEPKAAKEKVERRKSQAILALALSSIAYVTFVLMRKFLVGCETWTGILVALASMSGLGYSWYLFARQCSARDSDIFGIIQKILPVTAEEPPPMTCVYTGSK
jgi:hypothetical protein